MSSISPFLDKRPNSKKLHPITIRIIKDRKPSYIYLGQAIKLNQWDSKNRRVKNSHPDYLEINQLIISKLSKANKSLLNAEIKEENLSSKSIKRKMISKEEGDFFNISKLYLSSIEDRKQFHQYDIACHRIKVFKAFVKKDKLYFNELTVGLLKLFENHLFNKRNLKPRTVVNYMITIRTIFNLAISKSDTYIQFYPFGKGKYQIRFPETRKIGLNIDEVIVLENIKGITIEAIKTEYQHYDYSEDELKAELEEAIQNYKEELEVYNSAKDNGFVNGIMFHPKTYVHKAIFVKVKEDSKTDNSTYSEPMANRKMAECSPEEQIVKINLRETRKRHIEHNKQFEDMVQMIRQTDYIEKKKSLSVDEMVAFSLTLFENNVDYVGRQKHFSKLLGNSTKKTDVETVENFKKNFKKETFYKLIRYILTKQVHFGESNHINNLTNISFYNAMQGYYKTKIANIEKEYAEERNKREARLKERIGNLEKNIQELND